MFQAAKGFKAAFRAKAAGGGGKPRKEWVGNRQVDLAPDEYVSHVDVEAWSEEGEPLVLGQEGLLIASGAKFLGVVRDSAPVQLIPAEGWQVWRVDVDGTAWHVPIAAWALMSDGSITAAEPDSDGTFEYLGDGTIDYFICHDSNGEPSDWIAEQRAKKAAAGKGDGNA